jgi:hypothetical protein
MTTSRCGREAAAVAEVAEVEDSVEEDTTATAVPDEEVEDSLEVEEETEAWAEDTVAEAEAEDMVAGVD